MEIARAHDLHPTTVSRWKREFLENGPAVFGKDTTLCTKTSAQYSKRRCLNQHRIPRKAQQ